MGACIVLQKVYLVYCDLCKDTCAFGRRNWRHANRELFRWSNLSFLPPLSLAALEGDSRKELVDTRRIGLFKSTCLCTTTLRMARIMIATVLTNPFRIIETGLSCLFALRSAHTLRICGNIGGILAPFFFGICGIAGALPGILRFTYLRISHPCYIASIMSRLFFWCRWRSRTLGSSSRVFSCTIFWRTGHDSILRRWLRLGVSQHAGNVLVGLQTLATQHKYTVIIA